MKYLQVTEKYMLTVFATNNEDKIKIYKQNGDEVPRYFVILEKRQTL